MYQLQIKQVKNGVKIELPRSKSISNRLLIAKALSKGGLQLGELSSARDTTLLEEALNQKKGAIDVGMAGTAYRFLTSYIAQSECNVELLGATRMYERPIGVLVDVLRELGASIEYLGKEGYPPLKIVGRELKGGEVNIDGSVSSQFITALLLIAPYISGGLKICIKGELVSAPYVNMTLSLMEQLSILVQKEENQLIIHEGNYQSDGVVHIERDWSSAAFFYQWVALSGYEVCLSDLSKESIQGDKDCAELFSHFGVQTIVKGNDLLLRKNSTKTLQYLELDLKNTPDLIPSIIVTASLLVDKTVIKGVKTLRIKESDRIKSLQQELAKYNAEMIDDDPNQITVLKSATLPSEVIFETYNDHRLAMCLASLAACIKTIIIEEPQVVEKSFPDFWNQFEKLGVTVRY